MTLSMLALCALRSPFKRFHRLDSISIEYGQMFETGELDAAMPLSLTSKLTQRY